MITLKKLTIRDILFRSRMTYSNRPALAFAGQSPINYADMAVIVRNISGLLNTIGVSKGDKVALIGENSPNWSMSYLGITSMGAVVVPVLPDFSGEEMESIIKHSESKVVFISAKLYHNINIKNIPQVEAFVLLNTLEPINEETYRNDPSLGYKIPEPIVNVDYCDCEFPRPEENDLAAIIYTSGTTGRPKGVMLTHKNLVSNVISTLMIQEVNENDRLLSILPLSHTYECSIGFLIPMTTGASVYYLDKAPTPSILIPAMQKIRPTMMLVVPLVIEKIYKNKIKPELTSTKLKKRLYSWSITRKLLHRVAAKKLMATFGGQIRFFGVGGAKLSYEVEQFLYEGKFPYSIGYGMTETSPLITGSSPKLVKFRSAGFTLPGQDLMILEPNPETGEGEVLVRGNNLMVGYYKDVELTKTIFYNDWLRTGDLGVIDKNGYLELKGRSKNMILSASGENIYPEEIEDIINKHEFVVESMVYEMRGKLMAKVHLNKEALDKYIENLKSTAKDIQQTAEETYNKVLQDIMNFVNAKVAKFAKLNLIEQQREPFEKTPTQKIKRFIYNK
ncbi:MAG: AMP-binding protein [Bacteroidales bacterium]|nr:AMP-binding protein [Bacteroidales bacterium]